MALTTTGYPRMRLIATVLVVVVLVAVKVAAAAGGAMATEVPFIETEGGRVSGILEESLKGREFYSFYGIPFAQPPVGKLRFKVTRNTAFLLL